MTREAKAKLTLRDNPCHSCPYRRDVPSGVWATEEYDKLLPFDQDTAYQPPGPFMCHDGNAATDLCRGWAECHGDQLLSLRLAVAMHQMDPDEYAKLGSCDVPLFDSAAEASEHGRREIDAPGSDADRRIGLLLSKHERLRKMARKKRRVVTKPNRQARRAVNRLTAAARAENPNATAEEIAAEVKEDLEDLGLGESAGVSLTMILAWVQLAIKLIEMWRKK